MANSEDNKLNANDRLGHILVQILLMQNLNYKVTQSEIKKRLAGRDDAPTIKNMANPLGALVEGRDPRRTLYRPQTKHSWLAMVEKVIHFVDKDKILSDFRACSGLLFALEKSNYTGIHYAFVINDLRTYLKNNFQVNEKLFQLILKDLRHCEYTAESKSEPLEEQIFRENIVPELFFLEIAAKNTALVEDFSKR